MAITNRKGKHADFDPSKLRAGEWAVVMMDDPDTKDGKSVYLCFSAGTVKRMATYEDMRDNMDNMTEDMLEFLTEDVQKVIQQATEMVNEGNIVISNSREVTKEADAAAKKANATATEIEQKAENGDFSARIATVSAITGESGTQASVQNIGTEQEANFVFTIPKGDTGEPFRLKKTYSSVEEMNASFDTDGVLEGQFVAIDTGNVNDEDNAKLFMKGKASYTYITDLSGADGLTGPPGPQGQAAGFGMPTATIDSSIGTPSVTVTASGSDSEKVFSFAFHNLKGEPGAKGEIDENSTIQFQQAEIRDNIRSGETLVMIMGKIEKFFADLRSVAFSGAYADLSGTPEIPTQLPSPKSLIFTGATEEVYNGSVEKTVNIPTIPDSLPANGGNADTIENKNLEYIMNYENATNKPEIPIVIPDFAGTNAELNAVIEDLPVGTIVFVKDDTTNPGEDINPPQTVLQNNTWAQIDRASKEGKAKQLWRVGDVKDGCTIIGFDHDDLADGSGKAGITFCGANLSETQQWDENASSETYVNYSESGLNQFLDGFYQGLDAELKSVIKTVKKQYIDVNNAGREASILNMDTNLFLFSTYELMGQLPQYNTLGQEGTFYGDGTAEKVYQGYSGQIWTRTVDDKNSNHKYVYVLFNNDAKSYRAERTSKLKMAYGFCI